MSKRPARDPGAPKRNMSAYLLYQNAMRDKFKEMNPGMTFGELSKYTSAMYSELTPDVKDVWVARAEADKARYLQELAAYQPPQGYDAKGDAIMTQHQIKAGRKGKPEKDENAPKRNMSAYLLYQNAMRDEFKKMNPGMTFGQLAKYTSHMYKNLTPDEKATWETRARQDKERYEAEIALYVPPPGHDSRGILIDDNRPRKRNKRPPKDPAAPKRASGAYVFFTNDMRPQVLQEYPGIKFIELGKIMGERWRGLSPEEKKKYEDLATQDKERFRLEMQQYTANQTLAAPPPDASVSIPNIIMPTQPTASASASESVASAASSALDPTNTFLINPAEHYFQDPMANAGGYEAYSPHDPYSHNFHNG